MSTTLSTQGNRTTQPLLRPFHALRDEFDQLLSRLSDWDGQWLTSEFSPACDLSETPDAFQVRMDVPGLRPEDISVQVTGDSVRVSGERKEEKEQKDKTFHRVERRTGSFCQTLQLPGAVNEEQVQADFRDGVLTVMLPKSAATRTRTVKVQAAAK